MIVVIALNVVISTASVKHVQYLVDMSDVLEGQSPVA